MKNYDYAILLHVFFFRFQSALWIVIVVISVPTDTSARVPGITSTFILEDVKASITEAVEETPIATHHERNVSDHAPVSRTLTMETILVINQVPTVGFLTNTRAPVSRSVTADAMAATITISEASWSVRLLVDHNLTETLVHICITTQCL